MSIQIFDNTLIKILFRQGTDTERQNIILNSGEPGFTTDTNRLYVGDGSTQGGVLVGNLFKGSASDITTLAPAVIGDLSYNTNSNILYRLKQNDGSALSDWEAIASRGVVSDAVQSGGGNSIFNVVTVSSTDWSLLSNTPDTNTFYLVTNNDYMIDPLLLDASEGSKGLAKIATTAEAQAGISNTTIITPSKLQAVSATTAIKGVLQLATEAETNAGVNTEKAVTPATLAARTATDTRRGIIELATQAETNSGIDSGRAVTPITMYESPMTAKALVNFNASVVTTSGSPLSTFATINRSYNVSWVERLATGRFRIRFSRPMPDNYIFIGSATDSRDNGGDAIVSARGNDTRTSTELIITASDSGTAWNYTNINVVIF
jgi:hypothetical protein